MNIVVTEHSNTCENAYGMDLRTAKSAGAQSALPRCASRLHAADDDRHRSDEHQQRGPHRRAALVCVHLYKLVRELLGARELFFGGRRQESEYAIQYEYS